MSCGPGGPRRCSSFQVTSGPFLGFGSRYVVIVGTVGPPRRKCIEDDCQDARLLSGIACQLNAVTHITYVSQDAGMPSRIVYPHNAIGTRGLVFIAALRVGSEGEVNRSLRGQGTTSRQPRHRLAACPPRKRRIGARLELPTLHVASRVRRICSADARTSPS